MVADHQQERLPSKLTYLKYYFAGFTDGEGCFSVSIHQRDSARYGWVVDPMFQVYQHKNNHSILELFKKVLGCGYIVEKSSSENVHVLIVDNRRSLSEKVIPYFQRYPLLTTKYYDFLKFKEIVDRMERREHWEKNGLKKIIETAFQMNAEGKQRKYSLAEVLSQLEESPETIRQTPSKEGMI